MNIKRKIITLCLGLSVATIFAPPVQAINMDAIKRGIKIGSLATIGLYTGVKALKATGELLHTYINPDYYLEQLRERMNQRPNTQDNPLNTPTGHQIMLPMARGIIATIIGLEAFTSYIMVQNLLQEYNS